MILYQASIEEFNDDVVGERIAERAAQSYQAYYQRPPGDAEQRAWAHSLPVLHKSLTHADLSDVHIVVEYELPYSSTRIDVLLFGVDSVGQENVVLMELKQWSNENVYDSEAEGNVLVDYGQFRKEQAHPSLQVQGYHFGLKDFLEVFEQSSNPELSSITYAHNYSREDNGAVLFLPKFAEAVREFPIFTKEEAIDLGNYLQARLSDGRGQMVFERFSQSAVRPSKRLLDHTADMINKQQIFNLVDEQIAAYNNIMHKAGQLATSDAKSVVIVKGGPGTGKSVIALEVMGELLRQGKTVMHATGSSAFTNTLRKIVGPRARSLFKFFNSFLGTQENEFDVLVCDEAHRIRETSANQYTPASKRSGMPQINELFQAAKLSIFFIDEYQIVRPSEVGSVDLIKEAAQKFGISSTDIAEFELRTQFRCSGSDAYLQWIDRVLGITDSGTAEFDPKMQFKIFDSPAAMLEEIRERNKEKPNSARIAAGFCWPWSEPNPDGSLVNDVRIGDFAMPWERKDQFWKWATDDSGMEQVGTVYTAQGFEFDYIGVIFGNDLVYNPTKNTWESIAKNSFDSQVKRNNPNLTNHLKHIYRVLLSRAHTGVYIYFTDKDTEKHFRNHLPELSQL